MKLERFKFGDIIENGWAGQGNPHKVAIFIRHKRNTIEMTDGKGDVWETYHKSDNKNIKIGTIFDDPKLLEVSQ